MKVLSIDRVRFGRFEFDRQNRILSREGMELALPPRAVGLLACLIERPGQIVSKQQLLDEVWKDANVADSSLTEAVSLLRQVLADDPQRPAFIQTVPRRGYRFVAPLTVDAESALPAERDAPDRATAAPPYARQPLADTLTDAPEAGATASAPSGLPAGVTATGSFATPAAEWSSSSARPAPTAMPTPTSAAVWPSWLPWLFAAVTLALLAVFMRATLRQPAMYTRPVVRFAIDLPPGLRLATGDGPALALSRDGRRVAFVAARGEEDRRVDVPTADMPPSNSATPRGGEGEGPSSSGAANMTRATTAAPRLYVRDMERLEPLALDGTEGAAAPFFSPDGRWIGFFADGALKKVPAGGGPVVRLCAAGAAFGASWGTRHAIVFAASIAGGLSRVHEDGGEPVVITTPDPNEGELRHAWPEWLPDESGILFAGVPLAGSPEAARVAVLSFASGRVQTLAAGASAPHYVPSGHLLFSRSGTIVAAPFDPDTLDLLGAAVPVLDDVATNDGSGAAQFALAPSGHAAVVRVASSQVTATYRWLSPGNDAEGGTRASTTRSPGTTLDAGRTAAAPTAAAGTPDVGTVALPFAARQLRGLSLSPEGSRVAVSLGDGHRTDIWISDLTRGNLQRLTNDGQNVEPRWTPDGRRLLFASRTSGPFALFSKTADDSSMSAVPMTVNGSPSGGAPTAARHQLPASVSADGLVFVDAQRKTGLDLWFLPFDGGQQRPLVQTPADEAEGVLSPDGRWLAYQSNETGPWMAMVRARDGGAPIRVAPTDGTSLAWSPDGRYLYFTSRGRLFDAALASTGSILRPAASPRAIADDIDAAAGFCVARDGRLLVRARDTIAAPAQLQVVLDWSRELSAKVPVTPRTPRPVR